MAETKMISFDHKEVAEALVKRQDIHEGLWGVCVEFALIAANVTPQLGTGTGTEANSIVPAAIIPVIKIGIQRFDAPNNLTVNAAEVNPAAKKKPRPVVISRSR